MLAPIFILYLSPISFTPKEVTYENGKSKSQI